jgi:hypothetical protein
MKPKKVIVYSRFNTPFPTLDLAARRTREWTQYRFCIWQKYCRGSLLRQSHSEFEFWLICDPELKHLTDPLGAHLGDNRFKLIYDVPGSAGHLSGYDSYLWVRIDSDDMYHRAALDAFLTASERVDDGFIQITQGYVYGDRNGFLAEWNRRSPPFFAEVRSAQIISSGSFSPGRDHTTVRAIAKAIIERRLFVVVRHDKNTGDSKRLWRARSKIDGRRREQILAEFGL